MKTVTNSRVAKQACPWADLWQQFNEGYKITPNSGAVSIKSRG